MTFVHHVVGMVVWSAVMAVLGLFMSFAMTPLSIPMMTRNGFAMTALSSAIPAKLANTVVPLASC